MGSKSEVEKLISSSSVTEVATIGWTLLILASIQGHDDIIEHLIEVHYIGLLQVARVLW